DNASEQALPRFTRRIIAELGVKPGWHCLEVGAGGGNVAAWLCDRVGPDGHVLASDIDTRHLQRLDRRQLTILRPDFARDVAPEGDWCSSICPSGTKSCGA